MNGQLAEGGVGNLVRGTLGRHRRTGQRYPFLDPETLKPLRKSLDVQLEYLMEAKVNSLQQVAEALAWMTGRRVPAQTAQVVAEHSNGDGIAELKAAIGDLYNFLSQYVELDERGRGSCPFHPPDRNPSFAVNR